MTAKTGSLIDWMWLLPVVLLAALAALLASYTERAHVALFTEKQSKRIVLELFNEVSPSFVCDPGLRVVWTNPAFLEFSGYAHGEVIGANAAQFMIPKDRTAHTETYVNQVTDMPYTERFLHPLRVKFVSKDGAVHDVLMRFRRVNTVAGPLYAQTFTSDH
jgi:PAS domain S-box-containing protein